MSSVLIKDLYRNKEKFFEKRNTSFRLDKNC